MTHGDARAQGNDAKRGAPPTPGDLWCYGAALTYFGSCALDALRYQALWLTTWSEFNLAHPESNIAPARMKGCACKGVNLPHIVPLARKGIEILMDLHPLTVAGLRKAGA